MVDTNKILTVSYGTFSCTLEGFDDSFGTMKAIAEYFRDLAADDRYFGAEPPTPDAEMLARIAEKEISRRVEAHMEENKIVLRADQGTILPVALHAQPVADDAAAPAADTIESTEGAPAPVAETAPVSEADGEPQTHQSAEVETAPEPVAEDVAEDDSHDAEAEPVAEDTAEDDKVEAIDARDASEPVAQDLAEDDSHDAEAEPVAEDTAEEDFSDTEAVPVAEDVAEDIDSGEENEPIPALDALMVETAAEIAEEDTADTLADAAEDDSGYEDVAEDEADEPDNSVAAKLRRIRAVVSQGRQSGADPLYSEDEHAEDFLADTHEELEAALAIDDAAEDATGATEEDSGDDISALLERFGVDDHASDDDYEDEDDIFAPEAFAEDEDEEGADEEAAHDTETASETELTDDIDEADEESDPIRARVIKMKRADFEAAMAASDLEMEEGTAVGETSLSAEEEAELQSELASLEAEIGITDLSETEEDVAEDDAEDLAEFEDDLEDVFAEERDDDLTLDAGEDTVHDNAASADDEDPEDDGFVNLEEAADDSDGNIFGAQEDNDDDLAEAAEEAQSPFTADAESEMSRIFEETDTQMDEETGKGRRNAIAHLRAAVAAAKAEEGIGGKLAGKGPDTEAYRDDLASVVRPRRPETGKSHTRRPEMARPAPLKLVAEQRVDIDDSKPVEPVLPRRVARSRTAPVEHAATGGEFADYAESVGANSLPELLEAAAAYLSFVEGREQFSRPQLMTQVLQVEQDDFSREDGLRSFGQLLREGKIEKIEGGRFKASSTISYRPDDARYAGE
jgi:hypothetical protein